MSRQWFPKTHRSRERERLGLYAIFEKAVMIFDSKTVIPSVFTRNLAGA
jgi:hypothetical protein